MSPREIFTLRDYLGPELKGRTISDARLMVSLTNILEQSSIVGRFEELSGRSVLLAVSDQLIAAIAMTEIDGIAQRMLLCPPDLDVDHVQALIENGEIDAIVTDEPPKWAQMEVYLVMAARAPVRAPKKARAERTTEWLMLSTNSSGAPRIVSHTLEALTGAIVADGNTQASPPVWATFHDIRQSGGVQILLRAVVGGGSIVLTEPDEPIAAQAARLKARGVTHISGAPSHWRKLLMSGSAAELSPRYLLLSGEVADQAMVDGLNRAFPGAWIAHDYFDAARRA
jgi:hypothetical protein